MKRKIILLGAIAISGLAFSQVGVNTETPKSTFDVTAKKDGSGVPIVTDIAGMQAPRLTLAQLTAKGNSMYGADQVGALIYITDASGGGNTLQRVNITTTGYYYFDNVANVWQKVGSGTLPTGLDTTNDAFVNDAGNTMVKLGTNADGTARAAGTDFVIKDTGFVGIGIAAPTHPLHVNGAIRVKNITNNNIDITSNDLGLYGQNANIYNRYVTNAGDHRFYVDAATANGFAGGNSVVAIKGTPAELINGVEAGNMGIGTGAPTTKLHIVSATAGEGFRLEDGTQGVGKVLTSAADGVATWGTTESLGLDTTNDAFVNDAGNTMVKLGTNADGTARAAGTDFVIKDTGFVGIGTSTPGAKLDVAGTINATNQVLIRRAAEGGQVLLEGQNAADINWTIDQINNSSNPRFRIFGGSDEAKGIQIKENGNVGIGTSIPNARLDIRTNPTSTSNPGVGFFGLGTTTTAANTAGAGALRYDTTSGGILQYSNGTTWNTLTSTAQRCVVVAKKTTDQTVSSGGLGADIIDWQELKDSNSNFDPSTGIFTAPRDGTYVVSFSFNFQSAYYGAGSRVEAQLRTPTVANDKKSVTGFPAAGSTEAGASISFAVPLLSGETIRPGIFQLSGSDKKLRVGAGNDGFLNFSVAEL